VKLLAGELGRRLDVHRRAGLDRIEGQLALTEPHQPLPLQASQQRAPARDLQVERVERDPVPGGEGIDHRVPLGCPRDRLACLGQRRRQLRDALVLEPDANLVPAIADLDEPLRRERGGQQLLGRLERGHRERTGQQAREEDALLRGQRGTLAIGDRAPLVRQRDHALRRLAATRRQRRAHHLTERRLVVLRDPQAELDEIEGQRWRVVERLRQIERLHALRRRGMLAHHDAGDLARPEPHQHATPDHGPLRHRRWHAIGESVGHRERDRDLDVALPASGRACVRDLRCAQLGGHPCSRTTPV
jgi:hypothetical protein